MYITQGFGGEGGGGGSVKVTGNGIVVHHDGLMSTVPLIGIDPVRITSPEGQDGPPTFTGSRRRTMRSGKQLIELRTATGTTDQEIAIRGTTQYVLRRIVVVHASVAPAPIKAGGLYTQPGKAGDAIVPASTTFQTLTDGWQIIDLAVAPALRAAPYLYWSLTTPNGSPLTLDIYVYGDVIAPIEG